MGVKVRESVIQGIHHRQCFRPETKCGIIRACMIKQQKLSKVLNSDIQLVASEMGPFAICNVPKTIIANVAQRAGGQIMFSNRIQSAHSATCYPAIEQSAEVHD